MLAYLSERLSLPLAGLAVAGFFVGLSTSGLVLGLSIVGLVYTALLPVGYWLAGRNDRKYKVVAVPFALFALFVIYLCIKNTQQITTFGGEAGVGTVALITATIYLAIKLPGDYKRTHKTCPECANTVLEKARICQYCAYRWEPPLPEATVLTEAARAD